MSSFRTRFFQFRVCFNLIFRVHVDYFELLSEKCPTVNLTGSRYDHQISIFGHEFQELIERQKWFMIGTGALGCEYLKGTCQKSFSFPAFHVNVYN